MKKLILYFLCTALLTAEEQVVPLQEVAEEQFALGAIVDCQEGTKMPFRFSLQGECFSLSDDLLEVKKNCFVKCEGETLLFSRDLQKWSPFQEFFTGSINLTLTHEEGLHFTIELNQRA